MRNYSFLVEGFIVEVNFDGEVPLWEIHVYRIACLGVSRGLELREMDRWKRQRENRYVEELQLQSRSHYSLIVEKFIVEVITAS